MKDLTARQFMDKLNKYVPGSRWAGYMGYMEMPFPNGCSVSVCAWNAGNSRRAQLAYLLREYNEALVREGAE